MADPVALKLDHENHLLLDQPLLRLPFELLRKNFRSAHFEVERDGTYIRNALKETAQAAVSAPPPTEDVLRSLDNMLARARGMKRKLAGFAEEEQRLYRHEAARVRHLGEIYSMQSFEDVKYESWSRVRLQRMLVDYLLRQGYGESARMLAKDGRIEELVDVETFEQMARISSSLRNGSVTEALAWCTAGDTKKELRKMDASLSDLEFMLRYQQYIELVRPYTPAKLNEAIKHAQKWLQPYRQTHAAEVRKACGLLAVPPSRASAYPEYAALYSQQRWQKLAEKFIDTHNKLLSLPSIPSLHMALNSGLSALKTPACHSQDLQQTAENTTVASLQNVCPICSKELNELARNVPYAHHDKSHVEHDMLLLPNGRAYPKERLEDYAKKAGLLEGQVKDLRTGEIFGEERLRKVYIT